MIGMVTMAMEKMVTDIPEVMNDDHQFSHLVDEALLFDREIRLSYGFSTSYPCSLHVLSESRPFEKWIQIERKCRFSKKKIKIEVKYSILFTGKGLYFIYMPVR